jgi:hypothetical protein
MADSRNLSMSNVEDADHKIPIVLFYGLLGGFANTQESADYWRMILTTDGRGNTYWCQTETDGIGETVENYKGKLAAMASQLPEHWSPSTSWNNLIDSLAAGD